MIAGFALAATLCVPARAADRATQEEAVGMVNKALSYMQQNGADKMIAEANNPKGQFIYRDLYVIVYTASGKIAAHGSNPTLIGHDATLIKDADDHYFVKDIVDKAKVDGKGTVAYKHANPLTNIIESKLSYFVRADKYIIACGAYQ